MRQLAAKTTLGAFVLAASFVIPMLGASAATAADLALTATGTTSASSGSSAVYLFTAANAGGTPSSANVRVAISFTEPLVSNAFGTGWACTISGRDVTCTRPGPVAAATSLPPIAVVVPVHTTDITGWGFISPAVDGNFANDMAEVHTTALRPDVAVAVTPPFAKVPTGSTASTAVAVKNNGPGAVLGTTTVRLNAQNTAALWASGSSWACTGSPIVCTSTSQIGVNESFPVLNVALAPVGGAKSMALEARVSHADDLSTGNNLAQALVQVGPAPDLDVSMTPATDYFVANRVARHTVVVQNVGELTAFGPITVTARTADLFDLRATGNGWDCKRPDVATLICTNANSLSPGASLIPLSVNGDALGEWGTTIDVQVEVGVGGDLNPTNDIADTQTPIAPLIGLVPDIDDGGASTVPNGTVSYTVRVRNVGTLPSVGPITLEYEALGATLTGVGSDWSCVPGTCTALRNAPSLSQLPLLTLSGRVTGPGGSDVVVLTTLFNDSDETDEDDIVTDDTPIVGAPAPTTSTSTTTSTVAPSTVPPSSATSAPPTTATPPTTAPSSTTTSAPTTTTTTTTRPPTTTTVTTVPIPGGGGPTIRVADVMVLEPDADTAPGLFVFTLSQPSAVKVTVKYVTVDGSALAGSDYSGRSDTIAFLPGETTKSAVVPVRGDTLGEPNETFSVVLSSPVGAAIADGTAFGLILDNDPPGLTIDDAAITENDSGTQTMTFGVRLSKSPTAPVTVSYSTVDRDARAPADYLAKSGTLTFAAGETVKFVNVSIVGDVIDERTEDFHLVLSSVTGAALLDSIGIGKIYDDE